MFLKSCLKCKFISEEPRSGCVIKAEIVPVVDVNGFFSSLSLLFFPSSFLYYFASHLLEVS